MVTNFFMPALLLLFTLIIGLWLSKYGKPYKAGLFNFHKLLALSTVILSVIALINRSKSSGVETVILTGMLILSGFLVIVLFVSGALLSTGKPDHKAILITHRVAPILLVPSAAWLLYFYLTASFK